MSYLIIDRKLKVQKQVTKQRRKNRRITKIFLGLN